MTYKILNEATGKILFCSRIKHTDLIPNRRVFDYDFNEPNDYAANANGDDTNGYGEQAPNTDRIPEIVSFPPPPVSHIQMI